MIVYRIEDGEGLGPYKSGLFNIHRAIAREEIARDDRLYALSRSAPFILNQTARCWGDVIGKHDIFGCETADDLRLWYPSPAGCAAMAEAGARLAAYDASECSIIRGNWEVAFDRRTATRLGEASLDRLHG